MFKENDRRVKIYFVSCAAKPILSETAHAVIKIGDAQSCLSCDFGYFLYVNLSIDY